MTEPTNIHEISPLVAILSALRAITTPGDVFEIRIPKTKDQGTLAGYFDDAGIAAKIVAKVQGNVPATYITLNPLVPALLSRAENRLQPWAQTLSTDHDVIKRQWLPLDFDPKRPAGVSSTDKEHSDALAMARAVRDWLKNEQGWPDPILGDSGNGAHLLYRIAEPNTAETESLVRGVIRALGGMFSDDDVNIDQAVYNASRIWKLYGTITRKGDNTKARPHRYSEMLDCPDSIQTVSTEKLRALAALWAPAINIGNMGEKVKFTDDLPAWLAELGVQVISENPGDLFNGKGKKWQIKECPFNPSHNKPIVGVVEGRPIFRCLHQSCSENHWEQFRAKIDPSYDTPDEVIRGSILIVRDHGVESLIAIEEQLAKIASLTSLKYKGLRDALQDEKTKGIKKLDDAVRAWKTNHAEPGEHQGVPNNFVGLVRDIKQMQTEGLLPDVWVDALSERPWQQERNQEPEPMAIEKLALRAVYELHKRSMTWVKKGHAQDAIDHVANENWVNPILSWFNTLLWDGVPRLDTWLSRYMGVDDSKYARAVGRKWMISAVARGSRPGCQADYMLIFEGRQGVGKSKALRILGGEFHVEFAGSLTTDSDYRMMVSTITGKLIVEMSEMSSFKRSSIERLKHVLTATIDDTRLAYRRDAKRFPRSCVFTGSTNEIEGGYIHDSTGARRFWPVVVKQVDTEALKADRSQLWAEAIHAYKSGESWHPTAEECGADVMETIEEEQGNRTTNIDEMMSSVFLQHITNEESYTQGILVPWVYNQGVVRLGAGPENPSSATIGFPKAATTLGLWFGNDEALRNHMTMWGVLKRMGFHYINRNKSKKKARIWDPDKCLDSGVREQIREFLHSRAWERVVEHYLSMPGPSSGESDDE